MEAEPAFEYCVFYKLIDKGKLPGICLIFNKLRVFVKPLCPMFLFCQIDPMPFLKMCLNSRESGTKDPCITAVAYLQACLMENTPLRIPDTCVKYAHFYNHQNNLL